MRIVDTNEDLIDLINDQMPEAMAAPSENFNGSEGGIWFMGSEDFHDDEYIYDAYSFSATMGVHPKLNALLKSHGYYASAHDAGTLMAYKL